MPRTTQHARRKRRRPGLLLGSVALLAMTMLAPTTPAGASDTVKVCHRPPGNPSNVQLITVGQSAVAAHMRHGDKYPDTFYQDADGDGYGTPLSHIQACSAPAGFVANTTDCDDTRAAVHPGAVEIRENGLDDDLSLSPFNHRLAACAGHPAMIKDAAACHLHLQCDRKGWDKVLHLVHGHMSDLQERERDCRPGHCPPAIAGASVPQRHREP